MKNIKSVIYLCSYNLTLSSGKERATKHKLKSMGSLVDSLIVFYPNIKSNILRLAFSQILDLKCAFYIFYTGPDVFISRGETGFLSQFICRFTSTVSVREVHANLLEESSFFRSSYKKKIGYPFLRLADFLNRSAEIRWFNHPALLEQSNSLGSNCQDFFTYNAGDLSEKSTFSKKHAREKFGLKPGFKYLVFIGSASPWHGVEYLVDLQKQFILNADRVQIIVGGGDISKLDPDGSIINFVGLNSIQCADLIKCADACLLSVKNIRLSPGSPLKLYDYILNERFVYTQANVLGYSDEIDKYNVGFCVDFEDPISARKLIKESLAVLEAKKFPSDLSVTWQDRMKETITLLSVGLDIINCKAK